MTLGVVLVVGGIAGIQALTAPTAPAPAAVAPSGAAQAEADPAAETPPRADGSGAGGAAPRPTLHTGEKDERAGAGSGAEGSRAEGSRAEQVRAQLDALRVVGGTSEADYDRGLFGQAWYDEDRNGCDTRNDILGRDLTSVATKPGTGGCKVLTGQLEDWYSGTTVDFVSGQGTSELVQIDHLVPLSWAWRHGAEHWDSTTLRAFSNDPLNLVATTGQQNQQKSDSGPGDWLPASDAAQCRYVQRFTQVLHDYDLGVNLRDRAMMRGVLAECDASSVFGAFATGESASGAAR